MEKTNQRRGSWELLRTLLSHRASVTLGLAGRRGTGKTDLLKRLLNKVAPLSKLPASTYQNFKDPNFSPDEYRLHNIAVSVHSPADFEEMGFLSALFEQVALRVDASLAHLIPPVKPYPEAREREAKAIHQRFVHRLYVLLYIMLLIPVGVFIYRLPKIFPEYAAPAIFTQTAVDSLNASPTLTKIPTGDSLTLKRSIQQDSLRFAIALQNSKLYQTFLDSVAQETRSLRDSLRHIEQQWETLLNPPKSEFLQLPHWYESGGRFSRERKINYLAILDSLLKRTTNAYQPLLDSLGTTFRIGQIRLDSIAAQIRRYQQLGATLDFYESRLQQTARSGKISLQGLWLIFGVMVLLPMVMWVLGYEPGSSLHNPYYQHWISNEIVLYRRTQEVLARLHFHHSFAEGQEMSLGWAGKLGLSLGFGKSKQVTREQVPFTLLSLVDEYRSYVGEVCQYLNKALAEDEKRKSKKLSDGDEKPVKVAENKVKIYIAIDELDKVLDSERLHQMLKSIKAIFDLDNVYYLLSISEDALGTYRLRNVETKNEVDSAFTHILLLPPMEVQASIQLFQKSGVPAAFIASLVVYGAGVPRDMHRLADIALAKTKRSSEGDSIIKKWENLTDCVRHFFDEDKHAISDLISQQPNLSDIWKQKLLDLIEKDSLSAKSSVEKNPAGFSETHLGEFIKSNPGTEDENRRLFFKLHALMSGYFVKNHLHRELLGFEEMWLQNTKDDFTPENLPQKIVDWLEFRRAVAYDISSNPLGAWQKLKEQT